MGRPWNLRAAESRNWDSALLTGLLPPFGAPPRRVTFPRGGLHAGETHRLADASLVGGSGLVEALEADLEHAARTNRLIEVLGHATPEGGRAFEDPETGRRQRAFALYVVRPSSRRIGPLQLDGAASRDVGLEDVGDGCRSAGANLDAHDVGLGAGCAQHPPVP